jgi:multiple sugar transport system ATP-binding protein
MAKVLLDHITMDFGTAEALEDFCLEAADGEFLVLLGPAGAGKTTTLKVIAGLLKPTRGRVYFNDNDVTDIPANQRNVAMTFEDYALYPTYSVYENLRNPFNVAGRRTSAQMVNKRIQEVAKMLQIERLLERRVDQLSGGQKQRVALARSMVRQPEVFLFDEPLSHVDAKIKHSMRAELHSLGRMFSTTTIYVTHDYVEALALGDRVVVMNEGKIQQIGTPHDIYNRPANEFVATVVGQPTMNLLTCRVGKIEVNLSLQSVENPDLKFTPGSNSYDLLSKYLGQQLRIGIRPQDIRYRLQKENAKDIEGTVLLFEPWGRRSMIMASVGINEIKLLANSEERLGIGRQIWLDLSDAALYLFDLSGIRIP